MASGGNTPYLGSVITSTTIGLSSTAYSSGTTSSVAQIVLPNTGLYLVTASYSINPNGSSIFLIVMNISNVYSTFAPNFYDIQSYGPGGIGLYHSQTFTTTYLNTTASSTLYLNITPTFSPPTPAPTFGTIINFKAVSIA